MHKPLITILFALLMGGCDAFTSNTTSEDEIQVKANVIRLTSPDKNAKSDNLVEIPAVFKPQGDQATDHTAVAGTREIPYPIFPEAEQYRVGGENGLHIVLFETDATFDEVDAFYQRYTDSRGLSRMHAMTDYVRYSAQEGDKDAWATTRPGIVVHGFPNSGEAQKSGADPQARTNIILSF